MACWINSLLNIKKLKLNHFDIEEFDSPDAPGSGKFMDEEFLKDIDSARDIAGVSFIINSGYRTVAHNHLVGGTKNSSHLTGNGADIKCTDSRSRSIILNALRAVGITRIGIAKTFIHCDNDKTKDQHVTWMY